MKGSDKKKQNKSRLRKNEKARYASFFNWYASVRVLVFDVLTA